MCRGGIPSAYSDVVHTCAPRKPVRQLLSPYYQVEVSDGPEESASTLDPTSASFLTDLMPTYPAVVRWFAASDSAADQLCRLIVSVAGQAAESTERHP